LHLFLLFLLQGNNRSMREAGAFQGAVSGRLLRKKKIDARKRPLEHATLRFLPLEFSWIDGVENEPKERNGGLKKKCPSRGERGEGNILVL
jgi:hypothetical protein